MRKIVVIVNTPYEFSGALGTIKIPESHHSLSTFGVTLTQKMTCNLI